MIPREKTVKVKGAPHRMGLLFWGRAALVTFVSPPRGTTWGKRFLVHTFMGQPDLGMLVSPSEAREIAAELIRRAEDVEERS